MSDTPVPTQRYATAADGLAVGDYHLRCRQIAYRGLMPDSVIDGTSREQNQRRWAGFFASDPAVSGYQHVVAVIDDTAVGHVSLAPSRQDASVGEIAVAYVDPDHQRRGIGAGLLVTAHRMLAKRGFERAVLWTLVGNDPAISFYEKHGWELDGHTKVEVENGAEIHEIRMSLDLTTLAPDGSISA